MISCVLGYFVLAEDLREGGCNLVISLSACFRTGAV